jgi:hypothetical protein
MSKKEKMISELKKYYPIPNIFLGLNIKESKKDLNRLIKQIKNNK